MILTIKPRQMEGVTLTDADEESILYDPSQGNVHILNETGASIWELSDGNRTVEEIAKIIEEDFEAEDESVLSDVKEFVEELEKQGLLILDPGNGK
ncbi:MAG: PqqD family protein [Candidatus Eremiobacteraeota bacterium]|nr:PqqD family protein [Candidatus Eremiobacteraeota bacterium]